MRIFRTFIILFLLVVFAGQNLYSIPAFARKYRMSCSTCHAPTPKLKPYGDDFAGNGFALADKDAPRYTVETGDNLLNLIRDLPIAVRMDAHVTYETQEGSKTGDFKAPYLLKLLSGGSLSDNLTYYFYFYMNERGKVAGVEDAYIMYNNLFGIDLDIYLGQFQVSDPLFKRELRLTLEDYHVYKMKPELSRANLAYDRGLMITYGTDFGTDIILEILNGNGLDESNDAGMFDADHYKNFAGRVSQDITDFLRVGVFGYFGQEITKPTDEVFQTTNDITMFGPDVTVTLGETLELNFQYLQRKDSDIYLTADAEDPVSDFESKGMMGELVFYPDGHMGRWYGAAIFNQIESDQDVLNYKSAGVHAGYLLQRNIRLVGEYLMDFTDSDNTFNRFSIGLVTAF